LAAQLPAASAGAVQAAPASARVLSVTPHGDGTSCSPARPCSIEGAQTQVRQLDHDMRANLVVQPAGGTYRLSAPLTFNPADSGSSDGMTWKVIVVEPCLSWLHELRQTDRATLIQISQARTAIPRGEEAYAEHLRYEEKK
jgi:hypothetical protein